MKCLLSFNTGRALTYKNIKSILKNIPHQDEDHLDISIRNHTMITDCMIETTRFEFFVEILTRFFNSEMKYTDMAVDLLLLIFKLDTPKKPLYIRSDKKGEVVLDIKNRDGLNKWIIMPIDINVYKTKEKIDSVVAGIKQRRIDENPKTLYSKGIVRYDYYTKKDFRIDDVFRHDKSKYNISDFFADNLAAMVLLMYNTGKYNGKVISSLELGGEEYLFDCEFHGVARAREMKERGELNDVE